VDIFLRDHLMDSGRAPSAPATAAWDDPTRHVVLGDPCHWWQCADVKTDAPPSWQLTPAETHYLAFETRLVHESAEKGNQNRVYVQVHNRGPLAASQVTVKVMAAGASLGLPDLPADFWSAWPNSAGDANWTPIGSPQTLASLEPLRPAVLQWDWTPAPSADTHTCLLVVIDSPSDPLPASTRAIFDIGQLVTSDKRAGLKNLHLVDLLPNAIRPLPLVVHAPRALRGPYRVQIPRLAHAGLRAAMLVSRSLSKALAEAGLPKGLKATKLPATDLERIKQFWLKTEMRDEASWARLLETFDFGIQYSIDARSEGVELPVPIKAGAREQVLLLVRSGELTPGKLPLASWTLQQTTAQGRLVGGSTYVFKRAKPG